MESQKHTREMAVGTMYKHDSTLEAPTIRFEIEDISRSEITHYAQQLSLFLETGDVESLKRFGGIHTASTDVESSVRVIRDVDHGSDVFCSLPVEIEVEDMDVATAATFARHLQAFLEGGEAESLKQFAEITAASSGCRNTTRLCYEDGGDTPGIEWHANPDGDKT